ncbi:MAG: hypothetical protein QXH07_01215 [Thermoplasmata archaeon]
MNKKQGIWIAVISALLLSIMVVETLNYSQDINNFFQLNYAKLTGQFLSADQVGFFTNVYYPLNDQQPLSNYYAMLNGTLAPQFINMTRYIVGNQTNLLPLTSSYALSSLYPYIISPDSLIYANNPANIPQPNSTFYYIYPLYEVKYSGICSELPNQDMQIETLSNPLISFSSECQANLSSSYMNFTAIVGIDNNTATIIDGVFSQLNPSYQAGVDYLYPLVPAYEYNNNAPANNTITISNATLSTLNATLITPATATQNVSTFFSINITDNTSLSSIVWYANNTQIASSTFPANTTNATANLSFAYPYIGNLPIEAQITDSNGNILNDTINVYFYPNTPLVGTLQGYLASQSYGFTIINISNSQQTIYPIRNIYSGNFTNGSVFIDNLYCWNSAATQLTNMLQNLGYIQYPYLYQYQYNSSNYICLDVNSTNALLNVSANIDNTNVSINPVIPNLYNLSQQSYVIANATALQENFAYLVNGTSSSQTISVTSPYWFIPSQTEAFSITPSPDYVYTEILASQYYISNMLPINGEEPSYTEIPILTSNGKADAVVTNVTTYLYTPLLQNITYQYQFNQPSTGTPVYCTNICNYNGSLVYQDYQYDYQYASPDFGYVVLPNLNQTLYYTPQFSIIASTPLLNNTNPFSPNYGQLCLYTNSIYTCQYGLSPSQLFQAGTVNTFIMYQRYNESDTYVVNGQKVSGWSNFEGYLNEQLNNSKIVTIMRLNSNGGVEFSVTGAVESVLPSFIVISPITYNINPTSYPNAVPLTYSILNIVLFFVIVAGIPYVAYILAKVNLK